MQPMSIVRCAILRLLLPFARTAAPLSAHRYIAQVPPPDPEKDLPFATPPGTQISRCEDMRAAFEFTPASHFELESVKDVSSQ